MSKRAELSWALLSVTVGSDANSQDCGLILANLPRGQSRSTSNSTKGVIIWRETAVDDSQSESRQHCHYNNGGNKWQKCKTAKVDSPAPAAAAVRQTQIILTRYYYLVYLVHLVYRI